MKIASPARFFGAICTRPILPQGLDSGRARAKRLFGIGEIKKLGVAEIIW
jgi:hypothetical protein